MKNANKETSEPIVTKKECAGMSDAELSRKTDCLYRTILDIRTGQPCAQYIRVGDVCKEHEAVQTEISRRVENKTWTYPQ